MRHLLLFFFMLGFVPSVSAQSQPLPDGVPANAVAVLDGGEYRVLPDDQVWRALKPLLHSKRAEDLALAAKFERKQQSVPVPLAVESIAEPQLVNAEPNCRLLTAKTFSNGGKAQGYFAASVSTVGKYLVVPEPSR